MRQRISYRDDNKPAGRKRGQSRSNRRRRRGGFRVERLEERTLLTYMNAPIDDGSRDALLTGLDGFVDWADELSRYDALNQPLALIAGDDGGPLVLGEILDLGDSLSEVLVEPIRQHLETTPAPARDSDGLVSLIQSLPNVDAVAGGLETFPTDELLFDVTLHDQAVVDRLALHLGDDASALGLSIEDWFQGELSVAVTYRITFGLDLDQELSTEQAFFLRSSSIDVTASSSVDDAASDLSVGILRTPATINLSADIGLTVQLIDVVPSNRNMVTLSELNGYPLESVAELYVTADSIQATAVVSPSIGSWNAVTSTFSFVGSALDGTSPMVVFEPDSEPLWAFNNVIPGTIVAGLDLMASWLGSFDDSSVLDVGIPFVEGATLGNGVRAGDGFAAEVSGMRDQDGLPAFESLQEFSDLLGPTADYDPLNEQLVFSFDLELPQRRSTAAVSISDASPLGGLQSSARASVTGDGHLVFDLVIDLSEPHDSASRQVSVADLSIDYEVSTSASAITGAAEYGIVDIDFDDGSLTGTSTFHAQFVNPLTGASQATLNELLAGLSDPDSLLAADPTLSGSSRLDVGGISVQGSLFGFDGVPSITVEVCDFANPLDVTLTSAELGFLDDLSNLNTAMIVDSITTGITGTTGWFDTEGTVLDILGQRFVSPSDWPAVAFTEELEQALADASLQELPAALAQVPSLLGIDMTVLGALDVDEQNGTLSLEIIVEDDRNAATFDVGLNIGALHDLSGDSRLSGIGEYSGSGAELEADLHTRLDLDFVFDLSDPSAPQDYLLDTSELEYEFFFDTLEPLSMSGSIGLLGLDFDNGSLTIASDLELPDPASPATFSVGLPGNAGTRFSLDHLNVAPEVSASGKLELSYSLTQQPQLLALPDGFTVTIDDLGNAAQTLTLVAPDFPSIIEGISIAEELVALPSAFDDLFGALVDATDQSVFGLGFPLIGDALAGPANFLRNMHEEIMSVLNNLPSFDAGTVRIELEGIPGITSVEVDTDDLDDVRFTLDFSGAIFSETIALAGTDIGLPALGASLDADILVEATYDAVFVVGISTELGVYLDTATEDFGVHLDVSLVSPPGEPDLTGRLGFVEVTLDKIGSDTVFHADFTVDVTEPSGDDRLTVREALDAIGDPGSLLDFDTTHLTGGTGANDGEPLLLRVEAVVADWLPSVVTTLVIDWQFDTQDLRGSVPQVTYRDVGVDLGRWFENNLGPFIAKVEQFLQPIEEILDAITDPLPVLRDEPIDVDVSLLDLADAAESLLPEGSAYRTLLERLTNFLHVLDAVNDFANSVAQGDGAVIVFGDLRFGVDGDYDARLPDTVVNLLDQVSLDVDPWQQIEADEGGAEFLDQVAGVNVSAGEIDFPIFDQPFSVFEWLLGFGHVEIVTWELPAVTIDIPVDLAFPIIPGVLKAGILGSIEASTSITVGLDTYGFSEYARSGNVLDLFQGFYISDTDQADGSGKDVPEVSLSGEALAGLAVGFDIGGVGLQGEVGGKIAADIKVDLLDEDGDGKLRGHEFSSPDGCMRITGSVGVSLVAEAVVGPFRHEFPFTEETLADFDHVIYCSTYEGPDVDIANLDASTGQLDLYVGALGHLRSTTPDEINEVFDVRQDEFGQIIVEAYGAREYFDSNDVNLIRADAADGDDRITIDSTVSVPAHLFGGEGRDTLQGGSGNDTLDGGLENDKLYGGRGDDVIDVGDGLNEAFGQDGDDTINGGDERDVLDGGADRDTINGGGGRDVILGQSGLDVLNGGGGDDYIDGGPDSDTLIGDGGNDILLGNDGDDDIEGRIGEDYIEGGDDDDTIDGGVGNDTVRGGEGHDTISGSQGNDLLLGEDGDDEIRGQDGVDTIEGGEDNDDLFGNAGNDVILGENGNDTLEGGVGDDSLFGGLGGDTIRGNTDSSAALAEGETDFDIIFGGTGGSYSAGETDGGDRIFGDQDDDFIDSEQGPDTVWGGSGNDVIETGDGSDKAYGDDGQDTLIGGGGNDLLNGGSGDDLLRGQEGDDTLLGLAGQDDLFGDGGNDRAQGGTEIDHIYGGQGNDHLIGQEHADVIFGDIGDDKIEGNGGDDSLLGNDGADLILGDEGEDRIIGGTDNDTLRGGADDDSMSGGDGDDLMLGYLGDDRISGDRGNDVLKGYLGDDTIDGGDGQDRADGDGGNDVIFGGSNQDVLEGGAGDDTIDGGAGGDQLLGGPGIDSLFGGPQNDYLEAGDGIGNLLDGGDGDDTIVGSDDGFDDPDLLDDLYFGDVVLGGAGNDTIDSLGGADVIDAGPGDDTVRSGTHGDYVIGGPEETNASDVDTIFGQHGDDWLFGGEDDDVIGGGTGTNTIDGGEGNNDVNASDTVPPFSLSSGPPVSGGWAELSGSATGGGLSQVGGFEQAAHAAHDGVYVAWVDTRNGNSEIYLAFYSDTLGTWIEIDGSASAGGISDDDLQSRRPSIATVRDDVLVSWTSIDEAGNSTIEVASRNSGWTRVSNPAQASGRADHARLAPYSEESILMTWVESGTEEVKLAQFIDEPGCYRDFFWLTTTLFSDLKVTGIDLATSENRAAVAVTSGDSPEQVLDLVHNQSYAILDNSDLCPAVMPNHEVMRPTNWIREDTFTGGDITEPAVAIRVLDPLEGPEDTGEIDLYVAWHRKTSREDQVVARVRRYGDDKVGPWENMVPENLPTADSVSETIGYAARPDLTTTVSEVFLAWMDDSVGAANFGNSSIFVMSAVGDDRFLRETSRRDASGPGISSTGGALRSLSITADPVDPEATPYVAWTESEPGRPQIYVRHDQDEDPHQLIIRQGDGVRVTEGGTTDSYTIVLSSRPTADVVVHLRPTTQIEFSPTMIVFTPDDWYKARTIVIRAVNDSKFEVDHFARVEHSVVSIDPKYDGVATIDVPVSVRDNDLPFPPDFDFSTLGPNVRRISGRRPI